MSEKVGFDGRSFYCRICGRAGFGDRFKAYGHTRVHYNESLTPQSDPLTPQSDPLTPQSDPLPPTPSTPSKQIENDPLTPYPLPPTLLGDERVRQAIIELIEPLERRIERLERVVMNENTHLRLELEKQRNGEMKFLGIPVWGWLGIGIALLWVLVKKEGGGNKLADTVANKVVNKAIEVGVKHVFSGA